MHSPAQLLYYGETALISQVGTKSFSPGQLAQLQVALQCGRLAALWYVVSAHPPIEYSVAEAAYGAPLDLEGEESDLLHPLAHALRGTRCR